MVNYSIGDLCCPPSVDGSERRNRWFFFGLLGFIAFMIVFIIIGLIAGLWKTDSKTETSYYVLTRQWPITTCIARKCNPNVFKNGWIIKSFHQKFAGQEMKTNCSDVNLDIGNLKNIESELIKNWPSLDPNKSKSIAEGPKTPQIDPTTKAESSTTKATDPTTKATDPTTKATVPSTTSSPSTEPVPISEQDKILYQNQWKLYGTCSNMNQTTYFATALQIHKDISLNEIFKKLSPNLDKMFNQSEFIDSLKEKKIPENSVVFACKKIVERDEIARIYLHEIQICLYGENFEPFDCPDHAEESENSAIGCFGQKEFYYPSTFV